MSSIFSCRTFLTLDKVKQFQVDNNISTYVEAWEELAKLRYDDYLKQKAMNPDDPTLPDWNRIDDAM